ncbi:MAG: UPF0149 family protein [Gammaproteobacteria bacterium]|nr:UPF0149 family protein [Gammaproteobacteria bacterium]
MNFDAALSLSELKELAAFLVSADAPDTAMELSSVNGFLAAVALNPSFIVPSQWMPWVWDPQKGEAAPEFADMAQAQHIMGLLMRYYNQVVSELDGGKFEPLFYPIKQEDGSTYLEPDGWATAFMLGVLRFPDSWEPVFADHLDMLSPMVMLGTERGRETLRESQDPRHAIEVARAAIPRAVAELRTYFLLPHHQAARPFPQRRAEPKVGRNDPCPCGSGKKFKKCCARQTLS